MCVTVSNELSDSDWYNPALATPTLQQDDKLYTPRQTYTPASTHLRLSRDKNVEGTWKDGEIHFHHGSTFRSASYSNMAFILIYPANSLIVNERDDAH